jgi:hypothetical protein
VRLIVELRSDALPVSGCQWDDAQTTFVAFHAENVF